MKNLNYLFAFTLIALFASCGDDEAPIGPTGSVNMNWLGVYGGEPLVMISDDFEYLDGNRVKFTDVDFFISDVTLMEEGTGDEVELFDIEYVNFSGNGTVEAAQIPQTFSTNLIPAGNYSGVKIGFGVSDDLNEESSNQLGANHPLRKNGNYWTGWGSYIFTKINGQYDSDGNGEFDASDQGFSHHLGGNAVYRTMTFNSPLVVEEGQALDLNMVFDLKDFYAKNQSNFLDMTDPANAHTNDENDISVATFLVENFQQAVVISQ